MIPLSLSRLVSLLSLSILALEPQAQLRARRLTPNVLRSPVADVGGDHRFSPDGTRLVYRVTDDSSALLRTELYSADGNSPPVLLSAPFQLVFSFQIDPTGQRVVYKADEQLFSVPIAGGTAVQLTALDPGRNLMTFKITPDGAQVVFRADAATAGRFQLLTVPIGGGAAVAVSGFMVAGGDVDENYLVSPDSARVVYRADQQVDGRDDLYSARVGFAGSYTKLNGLLTAGGDVGDFRLAGGGSRVVYRADAAVDEEFQLFSAPIAAANGSVLIADVSSPGGTIEQGFVVSPDGARVVFRSPLASGATEVRSVPSDGSAPPVTLNLPLSGTNDVTHAAVSPDSALVVYRAEQTSAGVFELFSAPIDGSAPAVRLNNALAPDEDVRSAPIEIAPAGGRVVFETALAVGSESGRLFSAPFDGSAPALLLDTGLSNAGSMPELGPDGARVFYKKSVLGGLALLSVRLDGSGAPIVLGGALHALTSWRASPDSAFVAYAADQDVLNSIELFLAPAGLPFTSRQVHPDSTTSVPVGNVYAMRVTRSHAIYSALQEDPNITDLYSVLLSGGPSRRINGSPPVPVYPWGRLEVGAGERVVFQSLRRFGESYYPDGLYSVPLSGRSDPLPLNAPLVAGGSVYDYALSADGTEVAYRADQDQDDAFELYRAAIAVAASPVRLNAALAAGGDVQSGYAFAAGGRVVYVADQDVDEDYELFSADGVGAPLALSGTLVSGGDVQQRFVLSPDGARVFFRADKDVDERFELYAAPVDGSASPVLLSGALVAGGNVEDDFLVTPDGAGVFFRGDCAVDQRFELYSVPSDGSAAPLLLSTGMIAGGDVTSGFVLDPTSTLAVYRADAAMNDRFKLYSVPLDGSAPPVRLDNGPYSVQELHPPYYVTPGFQITPDGTRVLFLQQNASGYYELFSAPIGGGAPLKLNAPLSPSNFPGLTGFRIDPSGEHVVYVGDREDPVLAKIFYVPIDRAIEPIELTPPVGRWVSDDFAFTPGGETVVFHASTASPYSENGLYAAVLERAPRPAPPPVPH